VAKNKRIEKQNRRAEAERLRAEAKRAERRRNLIAYGSAGVVALVILALAVVPPLWKSAHDPAKKPLSSFGVKASAADCTDVKVTDTRRDHVTKPVTDYKNIPPASGPHFNNESSPETSTTRFFPPSYKTVVESYVHNLEHGYLVIWYAPDLSSADQATLKKIATRAAKDRTANKVKVVPWPKDRGEFPAGKKIALTAWGFEQTCGQVSGEAVSKFSKAHPVKDAPEPTSM
jgi:hypothetical protein